MRGRHRVVSCGHVVEGLVVVGTAADAVDGGVDEAQGAAGVLVSQGESDVSLTRTCNRVRSHAGRLRVRSAYKCSHWRETVPPYQGAERRTSDMAMYASRELAVSPPTGGEVVADLVMSRLVASARRRGALHAFEGTGDVHLSRPGGRTRARAHPRLGDDVDGA